MLLCIDFIGDKVNIVCLKAKKVKIKSLMVKESFFYEVSESLQLNVSNLGEYLKERSKEIKEIRVSGTPESTFHKIFVVPDLKKKLLNSAVETEVIKTFGNEYQFKQASLGQVPGPGNKVNQKVITAGMKRQALEELCERFSDSRVKPILYTTYPTAVKGLLDKLGVPSDKPMAFIQIDEPACRIVVFKGEEIRLTRELTMNATPGDAESSALAKDIYRTLLFYNDSYPEERAQRLILAGKSETREIEESLKKKTGAEIIPFDPQSTSELGPEKAYLHPACLGLALLNVSRVTFGFVPFSVQEKKKIKRIMVTCSSVMAGVLLVFLLIISRLSFDLKDIDAFQGGVKGEIKMKQDRLKEMSLEFISQSIESSQPPWSEILLELAAVVPPGVALKTLTLKNAKKVWRGDISGVADGSDEINSLLKVEEMESNFTKSPLFDGVKLMERELRGKQVDFRIVFQLNI
jgi:hypothetical protein